MAATKHNEPGTKIFSTSAFYALSFLLFIFIYRVYTSILELESVHYLLELGGQGYEDRRFLKMLQMTKMTNLGFF